MIAFPTPILRPDAHCWAATVWPKPGLAGQLGPGAVNGPGSERPDYRPSPSKRPPIEFGADLPVGTGRHAFLFPMRWYGIMLSRSRGSLSPMAPTQAPTPRTASPKQMRSSLI